jgi:hypothetical protein
MNVFFLTQGYVSIKLANLQGMQLLDSSIDSKIPSNLLDLTGNPTCQMQKTPDQCTIFHNAIAEFS